MVVETRYATGDGVLLGAGEHWVLVTDPEDDDVLDEIWAVVRPDNTPSLAVCARAGMTPRGRTTRYYGAELELFHVPRPDRG